MTDNYDEFVELILENNLEIRFEEEEIIGSDFSFETIEKHIYSVRDENEIVFKFELLRRSSDFEKRLNILEEVKINRKEECYIEGIFDNGIATEKVFIMETDLNKKFVTVIHRLQLKKINTNFIREIRGATKGMVYSIEKELLI